MKAQMQKTLGIIVVVGLIVGIYFLMQTDSSESLNQAKNQNSTFQESQNHIKEMDKSTASLNFVNETTNKKLQHNMDELSKMLEETKNLLKAHNKTQPNGVVISDQEIDRLLTLDNSLLESPYNVSKTEFDKTKLKDESFTNSVDSNEKNINQSITTTSTSIGNSQNDNVQITIQDDLDDSNPNNIDPELSEQIKKFESQISEVREVIKKFSANKS